MDLNSIKWLWSRSRFTIESGGVSALKFRIKLLATAMAAPAHVDTIRNADDNSSIAKLIAERPEMLGAFIWPFQNAAWPPATRWNRIINHTEAIDELGAPFVFGVEEGIVLHDLHEIMPDFKIVMDQPKWFMREGQLVLNLFLDDFRAFSLAFSFFKEPGGNLTAYIGAIQGRNRDDILATYRELTKKLYGIRPRDFLIEVFRMVCRMAGVNHVYSVSDSFRHHRHAYFGAKEKFTSNYDEIWRDRGGVRLDDQTFELSIDSERRELSDVKPNKRSMYRKRYEFLDDTEKLLQLNFHSLKPRRIKDS